MATDKSKITRDAMLAGIEALEIEVKKVGKKTDKELQEILDENLKEKELAFECGECHKEIPDLKVCPYCGAQYDDDDADSTDKKSDDDDDDDKKSDDDDDDDKKKDDDDDDDDKKPAKKSDKDDKKPAAKDDKKSGKKPAPKDDDEDDDDKKPAKKDDKKPAPKASSDGPALFEEAVKKITPIAKKGGLELQEKKIYFAWYKDGAKVFAVNKNRKILQAFFHPDSLSGNKTAKKIKGFEAITAEVAKERHYGSVRATYEGNSVEDLVTLVQELLG